MPQVSLALITWKTHKEEHGGIMLKRQPHHTGTQSSPTRGARQREHTPSLDYEINLGSVILAFSFHMLVGFCHYC